MRSTLDAWQIPDRKVSLLLTKILNDFQRSLCHIQCRQTLAVAAHHGVTHLIEKKQSNLGVRSQPFRSLSSLQYCKADPIFTQLLLLALSFLRHFPLLFFIHHLYLSVARLGCSLNALSSTSWVDMPLTADWLQVCFGTQPWLSFLKNFWRITYHTFNRYLADVRVLSGSRQMLSQRRMLYLSPHH